MELKNLLQEDVNREHSYLCEQKVGSEEYNASLKRLGELESRLFDVIQLESESAAKEQQTKDEKRDRKIKYIFEGIKTASGIIVPFVGLIGIMAFEKEQTFTSALRDYVKCFVPKKAI
jgi:hypothetical protein